MHKNNNEWQSGPATYTSRHGHEYNVYGVGTHKRGSERSRSRKRRRKRLIVVIVAALALVVGAAAAIGASAHKVLNIAQELSASVADVRAHVKDHDFAALRADLKDVSSKSSQLVDDTSGPLWTIGASLPVVGRDLSNACTVAKVAERLAGSADPLLAVLSGEEDANVDALLAAVADLSPVLELSATEVSGLSHGRVDKLNAAIDLCQDALPSACSLAHMAGGKGQRTYLIMAQTNSEIRSTGGFAGSWGTVSVGPDGLELGHFESRQGIPFFYDDIGYLFTADEEAFLGRRVMGLSTSVNIVPDFSHVGSIVAEYWRMTDDQQVDGVVAIDPVFLQSVLGVVGGVTTEDGTVVDGGNAADILLHSVYSMRESNADQDALFAEVAELAFEQLTDSLGAGNIGALIDVAKEGAEQGRLLVWMSREDEQEAVRAFGASGDVPADAATPQLGVYVNDWGWSKMGWWLDLRTDVGEPTENADGTSSYGVTTTLRNAMTPEEAQTEPNYVLTHNLEQASSSSAILDLVILLAPEGGSIGDLAVDGEPVAEGWDERWDHESHGTLYGKDAWQTIVDVPAQETVEITYTVTVPAEAVEPLQVHMTPTARSFE